MGITAIVGEYREFIASWKGFREFLDALEELGLDDYPYLVSHLPDGDEGYTSPKIAQKMLHELDLFNAQTHVVTRAVLVDSERGIDVSMGSSVLGGALAMDRVSGYDIGFDNRGFFVRDRWEMNRDLFRAMRVEQKLLHPETQTVEYIDRDSDRTFQCSVPFGKSVVGEDGVPRMYLREFEIQLRPATPARFAYITEPLRRALERAIDQQQRIHWA